MLDRIKNTVRDTSIYSLSNIAPKLVGVILLPLFTLRLSVRDFGNYDLIDNSIQILVEIVILGQASSIIFLTSSKEYSSRKGSALYSLSLFVFLFSAALVLVTEAAVAWWSAPLELSQFKPLYIRLAAYTILLRVMNNLFLARVRADEEAGYYTVISLARIILMTALTVYLVAVLDKGIAGILMGAAASEVFATLILLLKMIPKMEFKFSPRILKFAISFGFPLVFSSLGFMLLNQSDRFLIKIFLGSKFLAVYSLGYRVAGVLNMFLVLPFSLGLLPIAYKYFGEPDDKRFYSKLMTYSTFIFVWGFVFISLFSVEIVRLFGRQEEYRASYIIIPVILLSYVLSGMRMIAALGMMLTKNTKHIAWITIASSALNIVLNLFLIPVWGLAAAAADTVIAFVFFYFATKIFSDRYFKIEFENRKLALMFAAGLILAAPVYFIPQTGVLVPALIKIALTALFPILLYPFGFYEKQELNILLNPAKLSDFAKGIFAFSPKGGNKPENEE